MKKERERKGNKGAGLKAVIAALHIYTEEDTHCADNERERKIKTRERERVKEGGLREKEGLREN